MKRQVTYLFANLWIAALFGPMTVPVATRAATVWTGPTTTFAKAAGANPALAANQDRITTNTWLTRGGSQGLYNAKTESSFTHFSSPANTRWANGTIANYASLTYSDWNTWAKTVNGGPPSTIGKDAVVHLLTEDIYLAIKFTSWASSGGGGVFAYTRSTPAAANSPPSVTITNPANGTVFLSPATVTVQASASDSDGTVASVQFFANSTSLGSDSTVPFSIIASSLGVGTYILTARATDNGGLTTTSAPVTITVSAPNQPPSVSITTPANGASFVAPATVTVQASASASDGTVTNVQFFANSTSLGSDATVPFSIIASSLGVGSYILTARATDNGGLTTTSAPVTVTVSAPNQPPSVAITSPANGATLSAPATVTIQASASDSDGSIAKVEFFDGVTSLGIITTSPYTNRVTLPAGSHSLKAVATDNLSAATTSATVTVSVMTPGTIQFANNLALVSGQLPLRVTVTPGLSYAIDYSSTFTNWLIFTNFVATNAVMNFSAPLTGTNHRFFRARLLPNP